MFMRRLSKQQWSPQEVTATSLFYEPLPFYVYVMYMLIERLLHIS